MLRLVKGKGKEGSENQHWPLKRLWKYNWCSWNEIGWEKFYRKQTTYKPTHNGVMVVPQGFAIFNQGRR